MSSNRAIVILFFLAAGAGCSQVDPSNPFDPDTPGENQAKCRLAGTVLGDIELGQDSEAATALQAARVQIEGPGGTVDPVTTGEDGGYSFNLLTPGSWVLKVSHPGHVQGVQIVQLAPGQELELNVVMYLLGEGAGHLTGEAYKGSQMGLPESERDHSGVLVELEGAGIRTSTNTAGRFDVIVNPGTYDLLFSASHHHATRLEDIEVSAGSLTELSGGPVVLESNPGSVAGSVSLEGAAFDGHADVLLSLAGSQTGTSLPDGSFSIGGVPAGIYTLTASRTGFDSHSIPGIQVEGGRETVVPGFELAISRGGISGRVMLVGRQDHSGVSVELTGTTHTETTTLAGTFEFSSIPVGVYELTASKPGFVRWVESAVEVVSGEVTGIDHDLVLTTQTGDFSINGGASYTNLTLVELDFSTVDNAAWMKIGGDLASPDADFRDFEITPEVELSSDDGLKLVEAWFRTADGTESGPFSASIVLDQTPPELSEMLINQGDPYTNVQAGTVNLTLTASDETSGIKEMEISNTPDGFQELYEPYTASKTHTLSDLGTQGEKFVYVHFRDFAGNRTEVFAQDSIVYDTLPPTLTSFTIGFSQQTDPDFCNSPLVTLHIDSPDASAMRISNQSGMPGAQTEQYAATRAWFLSPDDGPKTVYLELLDAAGNLAGEFQDDIQLDTQPPDAPGLLIEGGAGYTNAAAPDHTVSVELTAPGAALMQLSLDGGFDPDGFVPLDSPVPVNLPAGDGEKTVYAAVRDQAGNTSPVTQAAIVLDTTAPQVLGLTVGDGSGYVTSPGGGTRIMINCADNLAPDPELDLRLTEGANTLHDDDYLDLVDVIMGASEGDRTVQAVCSDPAGNPSDPLSTNVTLDHSAPTVNLFTLNGGAPNERTNSLTVEVHLDVDDPVAGGAEVALSESVVNCQNAQYIHPAIGDVDFLITSGDGIRTLYLCARDAAGNISTAIASANSVELDTQGPDTPDLYRSGISDTEIELQWTTSADTQWVVLEQRLETDGGFDPAQALQLPPAPAAYTDPVQPDNLGLKHYYRLYALDDLGNQSATSIELDAGVPIRPVEAVYSSTISRRQINWTKPAGTMLSIGAYTWEDLDGLPHEEALPTNTTTLSLDTLDALDRVFNQSLVVRNTNSDSSLTWESEFMFGTLRVVLDGTDDVGKYCSCAIDSQDVVHLAYNDNTRGELKYLKLDGISQPQMLDSVGWTGQHSSIAIGPDDIPHISYYNRSAESLRYLKVDGVSSPVTLDDSSDVGKYSDIAVDSSGIAHISYFDFDNEDLKYVLAVVSPNPETLDSAGRVGVFSSIALDSMDTPYISYHDITNAQVKMLRVDGSSVPLVIDNVDAIAGHTSIAIDRGDVPHVAYHDRTGSESLKYVKVEGPATPQTIDLEQEAGEYVSIAVDRDGAVHFSYMAGERDLKYARLGSGLWIWRVDVTGSVGYYSSIAVDQPGTPHIAYHDFSNYDLKYVRWELLRPSITLDGADLVGAYASIAISNDGIAHIAYHDRTNQGLRYLKLDGASSPVVLDSGGSGHIISIDADSQGNAHVAYLDLNFYGLKYIRVDGVNTVETLVPGEVGTYISLAVDSGDTPHIVYQHGTNEDLMYLKKDGVSTPEVLDGAGNVGSYCSIAVDSTGTPHVAYYYENTRDLRYLRVDGISSPETLDSTGDVGQYTSIAVDSQDIPHISYHDFSNRSLKYLKVDQDRIPIVLDGTNSVRGDTSIAIDGLDIPHVSYHDHARSALRYIRVDGISRPLLIDDTPGTGVNNSIAVDPQNVPHIAFWFGTQEDLRYIKGPFTEDLVPLRREQLKSESSH